MAYSYRSSAQAYSLSSTTLTITKPTGTASGDLLFAACHYYGFDAGPTPPSGWASIDYASETSPKILAGHRLHVFYKVAGGSEPSDYSWTGVDYDIGAITCYSGADATPLDVYIAQYNGTSSSMTAASITTTVDDALVIFAGAALNASTSITATAPSGFTERVDYTGEAWRYVYIADKTQASAGATGTATATLSGSYANWGALVSFKPAAGGGASSTIILPATRRGGFGGLIVR